MSDYLPDRDVVVTHTGEGGASASPSPEKLYLSHSANRQDDPDWWIVEPRDDPERLEQQIESLLNVGGRGRRVIELDMRTLEAHELASVASLGMDTSYRQPPASSMVDMLATSIQETGIVRPITINERDGRRYVVDGVARMAAAEALGLKWVPVEYEDPPLSRENEMTAFIQRNTMREGT